MSLNITITNCKASDDSEILRKVMVNGSKNAEIKLDNVETTGKAKILEELKIGDVFDTLREEIPTLDRTSPEYLALCDLLSMEKEDKKSILKKIGRHMAEFSEGVLVNIVSEMLRTR